MKDKQTDLIAVLAMVGVMLVGIVAYAVSGGYKKGQGPMEELNLTPEQRESRGSMEELNLTPEQREKLLEQRNDPVQQENHKAMREQMKTKMQALNAAVDKPGTTLTDVSGLIAEVGTLQKQMFSKRMERLFAMKKILTPEQFAKMLEIEQMNRKYYASGKGKDPGPGQD
ncbi:MAG: Spy/CpxP family protein refolding chaperone [Candidatus Omnitrophota bacterium]